MGMCAVWRVGETFPEEKELILRPEGWVQVSEVTGSGQERTFHTARPVFAKALSWENTVFMELEDDP